MRKIHRTRHVALAEQFGTAYVKQHEARFARLECLVNVPAVCFESEQSFEVCTGYRGIRGRHFVINTAENGVSWKYWQYHGPHDNPRVCRTRQDWPCMTLGVQPTWHVTNRRWGLPPDARRIASKLCDAFLWIGRPWLYAGANPFEVEQALALARSTPFP